jgi:hypothetical protein
VFNVLSVHFFLLYSKTSFNKRSISSAAIKWNGLIGLWLAIERIMAMVCLAVLSPRGRLRGSLG